jgi:hypothetical protein
MEFSANGERKMTTPAEVVESLALSGTNLEQISQKLTAIRAWLATVEGERYLAGAPKNVVPRPCGYL